VKTVYHALYRLWYMGRVLRSSKPAGRVQLPACGYSDRPDYRYLLRRDDENGRIVRGIQYVADAAVAHAFQNKPARLRRNSTTGRIMAALSDHSPISFRQLAQELSLPEQKLSSALYDLYRSRRVVHSEKRPIRYAIMTSPIGKGFVAYKRHEGKSKRQRILEWISKNLQNKAVFTVDLRQALLREGVELSQSQIMDTLREREWAQNGAAVYVRGYQQGQVSDTWRAGEMWLKVKGNPKYLYALIGDETRYWIANEVAGDKFSHETVEYASKLFRHGKEATGRKPLTLITDGLHAYHQAYNLSAEHRA